MAVIASFVSKMKGITVNKKPSFSIYTHPTDLQDHVTASSSSSSPDPATDMEGKLGLGFHRHESTSSEGEGNDRKRAKINGEGESSPSAAAFQDETLADLFALLPEDLVVSIVCVVTSTAESPADIINLSSTCKTMRRLLLSSIALEKASLKALSIRAKKWSDSAQQFLRLCADAGNLDACYILGMIIFYCLKNRNRGGSLMAKAAIGQHTEALYSLAIIQFNGSGGSKSDKDLKAGACLCARASYLGHVDALRELGHCLQDGYGVKQNITDGRRFLVQANARELKNNGALWPWLQAPNPAPNPLHSDFGWALPPLDPHPANRFLVEWFSEVAEVDPTGAGLRVCSHQGCGRPETRRHEFRRCSICGKVNYCSRACQAQDWKLVHKSECAPAEVVQQAQQ